MQPRFERAAAAWGWEQRDARAYFGGACSTGISRQSLLPLNRTHGELLHVLDVGFGRSGARGRAHVFPLAPGAHSRSDCSSTPHYLVARRRASPSEPSRNCPFRSGFVNPHDVERAKRSYARLGVGWGNASAQRSHVPAADWWLARRRLGQLQRPAAARLCVPFPGLAVGARQPREKEQGKRGLSVRG